MQLVKKPTDLTRDNVLRTKIGGSISCTLRNAMILGYKYIDWNGKILLANSEDAMIDTGFDSKAALEKSPDMYKYPVRWENTINGGRRTKDTSVEEMLETAFSQGYEYIYTGGSVYKLSKDSAFETAYSYSDIQ